MSQLWNGDAKRILSETQRDFMTWFHVSSSKDSWRNMVVLTLWLFNIAMENGPFIDGLPIKSGDFPWLYTGYLT